MNGTKVTQEHVDSIFAEASFEVFKLGDKTTVVAATLQNGFVIVEASSCVHPKNYDEGLGASICKNRIVNKIWELEGYVLQTRGPDFVDQAAKVLDVRLERDEQEPRLVYVYLDYVDPRLFAQDGPLLTSGNFSISTSSSSSTWLGFNELMIGTDEDAALRFPSKEVADERVKKITRMIEDINKKYEKEWR